jgi:hypothetical protein
MVMGQGRTQFTDNRQPPPRKGTGRCQLVCLRLLRLTRPLGRAASASGLCATSRSDE